MSFEFEVIKGKEFSSYEYRVCLPHSCDEWVISEGDKQKTIEGLEQFIEEAQEALEELESME